MPGSHARDRAPRGHPSRMRWALPILLVVAALGVGAPSAVRAAEPAFPEPLEGRLQGVLDRVRSRYPVPGLAASVILADGSRWDGASGRAELGATGRDATPATVFVIGSITKTFVAALVVKLAEEGRLSLDDRLDRWVPEFPNANRFLLRQLLNHTSGIYNYFENPRYEALVFRRPTHRWTVREILALVERPYFAPGTGYHYSNTNYVLLGLAAERASRSSLGTAIRRRFLAPLGMRDTFFQGEEPVRVRGAMGYLYDAPARRFEGLADRTNTRPNTSAATVAWAAGAMVSTAHDVATWARALYGGSVLSGRSLTQMLDFGRYAYGLGTRLSLLAGQDAWGHTGSLRGFTAAAEYFPDQRLTIAVTTNRGRILPSEIAALLAQTAFEHMDAVAPLVLAPSIAPMAAAAFRSSATNAGALPVRLAWSATDDLSGIARFDLQQSVDGSGWRRLSLVGPRSRSFATRFRGDHVYRLRVRARDRGGNLSPWVEWSAFRVSLHDETSPLVHYSGFWRSEQSSATAGGSMVRARSAGKRAMFTFIGTGVAWISETGTGRGRADVYLDGARVARLNLAASAPASTRVVFSRSWSTPAPHSLEVRVAGRASAFGVAIDAFAVLQPASAVPARFARRI
jgi:D-alanyl-D-alanine carboxypeptidase